MSAVKIIGELSVSVFNGDGMLVDHWTEKNLIVNQGKDGLAKMLGGSIDVSSGEKVVDTIAFGSSDTPASVSDTVLADQWEKPIDSVTYPAANQVKFDWTLGLPENNGATIREFALITGDGGMFARKVRGTDIEKTNLVRLEGSWTVTFI